MAVMLPFPDAPYRFFPPKPNAFIRFLARETNRRIILPGPQHRIRNLEVFGMERLEQFTARRGVRLLFVPNHPTHSDPQIVTEVLRRCGLPAVFMAAYDVFLRGKFQAWLMQRTGSFSVDRDAGDTQSLKTAIQVLAEGHAPLTIFPEGNVHLANDRPASFQEGAAFIGIRAQKQLGDAAEVFAVPIAIKTTHLHDPRPGVHRRLAGIADALGTQFDAAAPVLREVQRIGLLAVERNLKQRGYPVPSPQDATDQQVQRSAEIILSGLEQKMGLPGKPDTGLQERVRRVRSAVHDVRADPAREIDHPAASGWADEAMLVLRLLGYAGNYLAENPTIDRFAETSERLAEDLYSRACRPFGQRHAYAMILPPVSIRCVLEKNARSRTAAQDLTRGFEAAVQGGLDVINGRNPHYGGRQLEHVDA